MAIFSFLALKWFLINSLFVTIYLNNVSALLLKKYPCQITTRKIWKNIKIHEKTNSHLCKKIKNKIKILSFQYKYFLRKFCNKKKPKRTNHHQETMVGENILVAVVYSGRSQSLQGTSSPENQLFTESFKHNNKKKYYSVKC